VSIQVRDLRARRGGFSLCIDRWQALSGEVQALLGSNGAGKSSLFAVLSGELGDRRDVRGDIQFHGRALRDWPARARARHIGVLPEHSTTPFAFTAAEVVALGLTPLSVGWREGQRRVSSFMQRCDCYHLAGRSYLALSGGERQRVNLARVLLQLSESEVAPLLLLDEPTSAQDLGHQHALLGLVRALARDEGFSVVAVLHDLNHALRYADRCVVLDGGQCVGMGAPAEVLEPELVSQYWGYRPVRSQCEGFTVLL
jgi:iron complex transport system ATP-binding protein